jgi:sister chromatid cohesion protein PDS5
MLKRLKGSYNIGLAEKGKHVASNSALDSLKKNLKELHDELRGLPQGANKTDLKSLSGYSENLAHAPILGNRDPHVRLLAACCISEMLRIYAPDAPYSTEQLLQIFDTFIQQFRQAAAFEPTSPWYAKVFTLIETIATVRISVLLTDIDAEETLLELFRACFDAIR